MKPLFLPFPSQHQKRAICSAFDKLTPFTDTGLCKALVTGLIASSAFMGLNASAATLSFQNRQVNVSEPNAGSTTVKLVINANFDDNSSEWQDTGSCTISGVVHAKRAVSSPNLELAKTSQLKKVAAPANVNKELTAEGSSSPPTLATEGVDYELVKANFSMTTQPIDMGEGGIQIDQVSDEIIFEIFDDGDEQETTEYIDFEIASYGVTCGEGTKSIGLAGYYGQIIIDDPFDIKPTDGPEGPRPIPIRQKSLTSQLEALRNMTLHTAAVRDSSIAKEINRARKRGGFSAENLQVNVQGNALSGNTFLGAAAGDDPNNSDPWGFFVSGAINAGKQNKRTETESDFDSNVLIVGADYHITEKAILGAALSHTDVNSGSREVAKTDFSRNSVSLFGSFYSAESYYVDALVSYGNSGYDLNRQIDTPVVDVSDTASATTDGSEVSAFLGAGYSVHQQNMSVRFFSFLNYIDSNVDGYKETVVGNSSAAEVNEFGLKSFTADLGVELSVNINTQFGVFVPVLSLTREQQLADDAVNFNGSFIGGSDAGEFYYQSVKRDANYMNAQIGFSAVFKNGFNAYLTYDTQLFRKDFSSNTTSAGVRWQF